MAPKKVKISNSLFIGAMAAAYSSHLDHRLCLDYKESFTADDIAQYKEVTYLEIFNIFDSGHLDLSQICELTQLETLNMGRLFIRDWPIELFAMPNLKKVSCSGNRGPKPFTDFALLQKLFLKSVNDGTSPSARKMLHHLATKNEPELKNATRKQILATMSCGAPEVKDLVDNELQKRQDNPLAHAPINPSSVVVLSGKFDAPAAELSAAITDMGATIARAVTDKTTHVIVGSKTKVDVSMLADGIHVVSSRELDEFLYS